MTSTTIEDQKWTTQIFGHPISWLIMTLGVVLIAYIWMAGITDEIPNEPVKKLSPETASSNFQQIEPLVKQEAMSITNSTDNARAQEYLAVESLETRINPFLQAARRHIKNNQFSLPEDDNAWNDYQQVLTIAPDNSIAKVGLTKIRNQLIDNAETTIEAGDFVNAEIWLVQLDQIQPDSPIQADLRTEIEEQIALEAQLKLHQQAEKERLLKIENSLAQAQIEEARNPINYNKIKDLYNRVLELDSENAGATKGIENLIELLLDDADKNLRADELAISQRLLNDVEDIEPQNKRLSSLQLALDTRLALQAEKKIAESNKVNATQKAATETISGNTAVDSTEDQASTNVTELTIIEKVTALEITQQQKNVLLKKGVRAYYRGDYNKSFELLYPLAEEGVTRAQFRIGVMYKYGRSVSKNADLSEKWFTRALPVILRLAQQGVPWAQTDLGTSYELGISLNQDFDRAAHWYRLAAEQNYPGAQTNLGVLYANGEGVNYSRSQAVYWLKKAARQGDLVALENLGIMGATL